MSKFRRRLGKLVAVTWRDAYQSADVLSDDAAPWQIVVTYGRLQQIRQGTLFVVHEEIADSDSRAFTAIPKSLVVKITRLRQR